MNSMGSWSERPVIAQMSQMGNRFSFHLSYDGEVTYRWHGAALRASDRGGGGGGEDSDARLRARHAAPWCPSSFNRGVWPYQVAGVGTVYFDSAPGLGAPPVEAVEQLWAMAREGYMEHLAHAVVHGYPAEPIPVRLVPVYFDSVAGAFMTTDGRPAHIEADGFRDPAMPAVHWTRCPECGETFVRRQPRQEECWACTPALWVLGTSPDCYRVPHGVPSGESFLCAPSATV